MIETSKSIMMDHVWNELLTIVDSLVIKQKYIADRYETKEITYDATNYLLALTGNDSFYSYRSFSKYALEKAGLTNKIYLEDKNEIPKNKRELVLTYQREYVLDNYEEKNNYYRRLIGLPDIGDDPIYISQVVNGVDISKPIHEMTHEEIVLIESEGILAKLKEKYPKKKYLNFLHDDDKISIYNARKTADFDILRVTNDRSKPGTTEMFVALYRSSREYVLEKFYDDAYKFKSPYYDAFIGLFILCITMQRYVTNYTHRFINRDFYNKDIIKLLFESYDIPFYNDIPLSYLQKVAKNLNRLLMYKATDKVFTDIFKIFDIDNINIYNYLLFKDRLTDANGDPIFAYKTKDISNYLDVITYKLNSNDEFMGQKYFTEISNINKIRALRLNETGDKILFYLLNDKSFLIKKNANMKFVDTDIIDYNDDYIKIDDNIVDIYMPNNNRSIPTYYKAILKTEKESKFYMIDGNTIYKYDITGQFEDTINKVCFNMNYYFNVVTISYGDYTSIYVKGNFIDGNTYDDYTEISTIKAVIISVACFYKHKYLYLIDNEGKCYTYTGDLEFYQEVLNRDKTISPFKLMTDVIYPMQQILCVTDTLYFLQTDGVIKRYLYSNGNLLYRQEYEYTDVQELFYIANTSIENNKILVGMLRYNGKCKLLNYNDSEYKYANVLFNDKPINGILKYNFIKDIYIDIDDIYITMYTPTTYYNYAGDQGENLPVTSSSFIQQTIDVHDFMNIELYNDVLYTMDINGKVYYYNNKQYKDITPSDEDIQSLNKTTNGLFLLVGKNYMYKLDDTDNTFKKVNPKFLSSENIELVDKLKIIRTIGDIFILARYNSGFVDYKTAKYIDDNLVIYDRLPKLEDSSNSHKITLEFVKDKYLLKMYMVDDYTFVNPPTVYLSSLKNIINIKKYGNYIYFFTTGFINNSLDTVYMYSIKDLKMNISGSTIDIVPLELDNEIDSVKIYNNEAILLRSDNGMVIIEDFIHKNTLETDIEDSLVTILEDQDIKSVTWNDRSFMILSAESQVELYEEDYEKMYKLKFVEVPMDAKNIPQYLVEQSNYLDYELVVSDDALWTGDDDKETFMNEVLGADFNYVTSKYISVNSRYDLCRLNLEITYMFRMLVDLKKKERLLSINIPDVGPTNLFDAIIALFQLTCYKYGFEATIPKTSTKVLSVMGFNFTQNMYLIDKIIKKYRLKDFNQDFDRSMVKIKTQNFSFKSGSEVVNLFLENMDILETIRDLKYSAKTIEEYNAYKQIEQATIITECTNDVYKINDIVPETYSDYLKLANIDLYNYVNNTDDENIIDQIDNILVSLEALIDSDKFKYLFLNIPALSLDNLRKFVFYLVDIFKSYTVDLKAMNIIYHIDDKRLNNIKMILEEDNFDKIFSDFSEIMMDADIKNSLKLWTEKQGLDFSLIEDVFNKEFTKKEKIEMYKLFKTNFSKFREHEEALFRPLFDFLVYIQANRECEDRITIKDSYEFIRNE